MSDPALEADHRRAANLARERRYGEAVRLAEDVVRRARESQSPAMLGRALGGLCYLQIVTFQYREAAASCLEGRQQALTAGRWGLASLISNNLANLYSHLGAYREAGLAVSAALEYDSREAAPRQYPRALLTLQQARVQARVGGLAQAESLFRQAAEEAHRAGDVASRALAWESLARQHLFQSRLEAAESYLLESYRLRLLAADSALSSSYFHLAWLRSEQGRPAEALTLIEAALTAARRKPSHVPLMWFLSLRGRIRLALEDESGAERDLLAAIDQIRDIRLAGPSADTLMTASTAFYQSIYSQAVDLYARRYLRSGREDDLRRSLQLASENRGYALRQMVRAREAVRGRLPPDYFGVLARLQQAESDAFNTGSAASMRETQSLRLRLTEMEMAAGVPESLRRNRDEVLFQPGPGEAVLQFHLGERQSYLWAWTARRAALKVLPGKRTVETLAAGVDDSDEAAARFYREVLDGLPDEVRRSTLWWVVPDGRLHTVPFAALRTPEGRYLVEDRAVQLLPGAGGSGEPDVAGWRGGWLGLADAIYNTADERFARSPNPVRPLGWQENYDGQALNRLPGTAREAEACARLWPPEQSTVLRGADAELGRLRAELARRPEVLHLATHMVAAPGDAEESRIVLSLDSGAEPQLLDPDMVASLRAKPRLVFLSGCRAGAGRQMEGEGVLGLARAWLAGGAGTVVATRWPVNDDSGDLAWRFYRHWRQDGARRGGAATALRQAQMEMIRAGGWKARPRNWAAHFVIGKN